MSEPRRTIPPLRVDSFPSNLLGHALGSAKGELIAMLKDGERDPGLLRTKLNEVIDYQTALDVIHGYTAVEETPPL